jgi:hypothetical protein
MASGPLTRPGRAGRLAVALALAAAPGGYVLSPTAPEAAAALRDRRRRVEEE